MRKEKWAKTFGMLQMGIGSANLNNVYARNIYVLSGREEGYDLSELHGDELTIDTKKKINIKSTKNNAFGKTIVKNDAVLEGSVDTFGEMLISSRTSNYVDISLKGAYNRKITAETSANIKNLSGNTNEIQHVSVSPINEEYIYLTLDGKFNDVYVNESAYLEIYPNSKISRILSYEILDMLLWNDSEIDHLQITDGASAIVAGDGKIIRKTGDVRKVIDKDKLPAASDISGIVSAELYFALDAKYEFGGYVDDPKLRIRLINPDGSSMPVESGRMIYIDDDSQVAELKNDYESGLLSIPE